MDKYKQMKLMKLRNELARITAELHQIEALETASIDVISLNNAWSLLDDKQAQLTADVERLMST